jgi:hypothetical protein
MLDPSTLQTNPKFLEMDNIIHLDEKWYNATKKGTTYYLHPDEDEPHRIVRNKNRIGKVMFLTAVAKPRYDDEQGLLGQESEGMEVEPVVDLDGGERARLSVVFVDLDLGEGVREGAAVMSECFYLLFLGKLLPFFSGRMRPQPIVWMRFTGYRVRQFFLIRYRSHWQLTTSLLFMFLRQVLNTTFT